MDALTFDDLPSIGSAAKLSAPLTFDDIEPADEGGILSSIGNIGRGIGERASSLAGDTLRTVNLVGGAIDDAISGAIYAAKGEEVPKNRPTSKDAQAVSNELSKALKKLDLGYEEGTSWEDFKKAPVRNFIPFAIEQGLVSAPDMAYALGNLPMYIGARTGELGQERAENNNLDNATIGDLVDVLPAAAVSSLLERIGAAGIFKDVAVSSVKGAAKAIGKATVKEGTTEAGQELIEYGATTVGTERGFDPAQAGERMLAGAVGGAGFGGIARAATAGVEATTGRGLGPSAEPAGDAAPEATPSPQADVDATSAGDSADVLYGADPVETAPQIDATPETVVPQQEAVSRLQTPDPERLDSPRLTPEDRSSPLPNALIDDGKAIIEQALAPAPQEAAQTQAAPSAPLTQPQEAQASPAPSVARPSAVTFDDIPDAAPVDPSSAPQPTASWVIRDKATGEVVMETFERSTIERINTSKYEAVPVQEHLAQINSPTTLAGSFARREGQPAPQSAPVATPTEVRPKAPPTPRMTPDGFPADRMGNVLKPKSLIEFLIDRGGVQDQGGDIRAAAAGRGSAQFAKGFGSLVRKNGMTLDEARKLAVEAGYLTDRGAQSGRASESYISDLLDAIEEDARSGRQLFSSADANQVVRWQEEQRIKQDLDRYGSEEEFQAQEAMERALDEVAALTGRDRADKFSVEIATVMANEGVDFDTAAVQVDEQRREKFFSDASDIKPARVGSLADIPFFDDEANAATSAEAGRDDRGRAQADSATDAGAVYAGGIGTGGPVDQRERAEAKGGAERSVGAGEGTGRVQADDGRGQPEARQPKVGGRKTDRIVAGKRVEFPDEYHAEVYDLGVALLRDNGVTLDRILAGTVIDDIVPEDSRVLGPRREEAQRLASTIGSYMDPTIRSADEMGMAAMEIAVMEFEVAASKRSEGTLKASSIIDVDAQQEWSQAVLDEVRRGNPVSPRSEGDLRPENRVDEGEPTADITTEPGADGKPQMVIPGAEQISQREQAQRKADAKLTPKVEQKDADGLFGDDVNSPQLFDQPAPKVEKLAPKVSDETPKATSGSTDEKMFSRRQETEQTPAFKRWFGDSKVVDAKGEPLVVYHGTRSDFDAFEIGKEGSHFGTGSQAKMRNGKRVIEAYLSIKNPKRVKDLPGGWQKAVKAAKSQGHDGIVYLNRFEGVPYERFEELRARGISDAKMDAMSDAQFRKLVPEASDSWVAFEPTQIKSVENRGTFSPEDDRIMFQRVDGLTDQFTGDIDAVTSDLRARLDKLGLSDVSLRVVPVIEGYANGERFTADGSYFRGLIEVSLSAPNKVATLNHEAIHALKNLRLFNTSEWSILSSRSERDWIPSYGVEKAYEGSSREVMIEEGVASAYVDWAEGKQMAGPVPRLFQRVKDFIAALGNALRGRGFDSVGMIFERIESGEIGSRGLFRNGPDAKGEKRFSLSEEPKTPQEKQQVMQGFIARGQPIDRAIRMPFELFGGLTKDGIWKPAQKLNVKLGDQGRLGLGFGGVIGAGIGGVAGGPIGAAVGGSIGATAGVALLRANISPNGKFGWMHSFAENARRGLVDRYGLSEEYVAADRSRQTAQRGIMQKAEDILQVLQNASVGPQEAKVLQAVLTGENVTDADMMKVAAPIRAAIDELGAEAVSLGLISAESFERNRGAYLHRVYQKNEMDQNGVIAWAGKFMQKKRVKIMGDQLKGRGLFWDVPVERLMADVPGWVEGESGGPVMGQKFRVLDYVPGTSMDMLSGEARELKTKRRAYLPADKPLPDKFTGPEWQDRGTWEVRSTGKNKATIWRDYTKEERTKMGEILDARYTIAKTFMLMANDLSTGRFYKQVAENGEWAQKEQPTTEWREAADYGRFWNDPNIGWVRVPETTIANSGGKKRYGALAGMFVRAEIWRDLNEVDQMQQAGLWRTILTQWKINKTARSPVTHMNNIMSNMMFMDLGDVRMQDLVAGVKAFATGSKDYIEARDAGAFGSDMISQEIRQQVLQPILDEIAKTGTDGKNPLLARMGVVGTVADKIWTWAKAADDRMLQAYQLEDEVFRMATYMRRRSLGDSVEAAARNAREQFLDYDIRAPWINAARNSVLPFISYSYRAIPKIAENISNRPWKLAKYFALAYAANMLAYAWDDGDDGEERERASLRDEEQGWTWLGVPRMLRMPYRDADGMPVFLDIRRWIPSGDVFDINQGQSAIPVPASLQLGGPLLLAFEFALNKQAFTGNEITNELTDTSGDKVAKVGDWLWKSWMPSAAWVPNSWYYEKIENAIKGAEDYSGRKYSLLEASLSSIGIKLKPQNVEDGLGWKQRAFEEVERALRTEARRLANRRERGLISESEFNKSMAELTEKFANLGEKAKDLGERAQKKPAN